MSAHAFDRERPQRFVVAGAAGFIGSHLVDRLLDLGHTVIGVDNLLTGDAANLAHLAGHPGFKFLRHDVIEPLSIDGPVSWIMHLASPASPPKYLKHPLATLRCNADGTFQLLELARRTGAGLFFASTSEVYGDPAVHPQPESYWGHVNPNGPRSVYDEAKRYAEALITAYHQTSGVPVRIVRIFNTYGPRMKRDDGRVVVNFIGQALAGRPLTVYGNGSQTRSFQYVDDLIEGFLRLLAAEYTMPVNIGNPEEYTVLELAEMVKRITGAKVPIVHRALPKDDPQQRRPDISLAARLLGWTPTVSVEDGLVRTIAHFRESAPRPVRRTVSLAEAVAPAARGGVGSQVVPVAARDVLRRPARG